MKSYMKYWMPAIVLQSHLLCIQFHSYDEDFVMRDFDVNFVFLLRLGPQHHCDGRCLCVLFSAAFYDIALWRSGRWYGRLSNIVTTTSRSEIMKKCDQRKKKTFTLSRICVVATIRWPATRSRQTLSFYRFVCLLVSVFVCEWRARAHACIAFLVYLCDSYYYFLFSIFYYCIFNSRDKQRDTRRKRGRKGEEQEEEEDDDEEEKSSQWEEDRER